MKEAFDGVSAEAAMIRSPSFSREGESRMITNSSFARELLVCRVRILETTYQRLLLCLVLSRRLGVRDPRLHLRGCH